MSIVESARYISYLRVSTQRQGLSGLGLDAQRCAVSSFVTTTGGELLDEVVEIESGRRRDRPGLVQSIALCRKHRATLLIAKLDRLARNVAFISSLMESGVEFVAVDAPYANKLMLHIMAAFAEHERELISERTRAALAAAKARGVRLGVNGTRLAEQRKVEAVAIAQRLAGPVQVIIEGGARTLADIARELNAMDYRTRNGEYWTTGTVHRLLKRLTVSLTPTNST